MGSAGEHNDTAQSDAGDLGRNLDALYSEETGRFDRLAVAAGLRPRVDFRRRDLRTLSFAAADLRGFDFSGSDLTGTGLRHAALIDETTAFADARLDQEDREWLRRRTRPPLTIAKRDFVPELRAAVEREELFLVYQPKVSLATKSVIGLEALMRWRHPRRGLLSPADFIPEAEDFGIAAELTLWAMDRARQAQRRLAEAGHDVVVSVNISPDLLLDDDALPACVAALELSGGRIGLEFPEIAVIRDPETAIASLNRLHAAGAHLAIDDYGTGLSSLLHLREIPARELKIDQMFIRNLTSSSRDPLVVRSTIDLAHALDMKVTAEGVETPAALALLGVMRCDAVQGYLIGRPMGLAETLGALKTWSERDPPNRMSSDPSTDAAATPS